jgi:hypothetical protein
LLLLLNAKDMLRCGQNQGCPSARANNPLDLDFVPRFACLVAKTAEGKKHQKPFDF